MTFAVGIKPTAKLFFFLLQQPVGGHSQRPGNGPQFKVLYHPQPVFYPADAIPLQDNAADLHPRRQV